VAVQPDFGDQHADFSPLRRLRIRYRHLKVC
jgi:hypothetical protein